MEFSLKPIEFCNLNPYLHWDWIENETVFATRCHLKQHELIRIGEKEIRKTRLKMIKSLCLFGDFKIRRKKEKKIRWCALWFDLESMEGSIQVGADG